MSLEPALGMARVALATALATGLCARLAPRLGWTDAPEGREAARKLQGRAVPAVGGVALLVGLACAPGNPWAEEAPELWGSWLPGWPWRWAGLGLFWLMGTLDDRARLTPGRKALAQLVALAPLGLGAALEHGWPQALALVGIGFAVLNLLNTFDNADGALAGVCALGFAASAPLLTAACLGFLPWNLDAARARNAASRAPSAYLGDAGSSVLSFWVLMTPGAVGLLVLPGLDLARLSLLRWRTGSAPWIGDRRHLAHRLEARGLARPVVAGLLCVLAAPACVLVPGALGRHDAGAIGLGLLATTVLFLLALRLTPAPPGHPRSRSGFAA